MDEYYLALTDDPIRFDSVSQLTNVFFDDTNGQVFAVRSGGVTGVIVKGPDRNASTTFRMEDKGRVISIKFSPDLSVLAVQRSHTTVDFINFANLAPASTEYSHSCKWKNASILGFYWIEPGEIAFVTDHGIELLQIAPEKKQLKTLKTVKISVSWFSWCVQSKLVLASSKGLQLHPFTFNNSTINKLPHVDMETAVSENDISCARLYRSTWCLVLKHGGKCPAEVLAVPLDATGSTSLHALRTGLIGRFAINVVDDLVVVHHQASQTSMLFDIMEEGVLEGEIRVHAPIAAPKSLEPVSIPDLPCPMYSGNWVVFQPDVVIDARLGCLWHVVLRPAGLLNENFDKIVGVLLRRANGKEPIFAILNRIIASGLKYLDQLMKVFDQINAVYKKQAELDLARQMGHSSNRAESQSNAKEQTHYHRVVITQQDIYTNVLQHHTDSPYIIQIVLNYMCSLARHQVSPQHALTEMLVRALVHSNKFSDLHQLLQYGAVGDSKPLACLLLSLVNLHPAAHQLALDMLHRLCAHEEVVEVLLGDGEVIAGVGVAKQYGAKAPTADRSQFQSGDVWSNLRARKILSAARNDLNKFISVYHALENRNQAKRNSQSFTKGEQCDSYVQLYSTLFPEAN